MRCPACSGFKYNGEEEGCEDCGFVKWIQPKKEKKVRGKESFDKMYSDLYGS